MKFPEQYRWKDAPSGYNTNSGDPFGIFVIRHGGVILKVIACDGHANGWEHVSVSIGNAGSSRRSIPTWEEMCFVKSLFWDDEETVVQFHPAKSEYVNIHNGCLHLWRHVDGFKTPPKDMV